MIGKYVHSFLYVDVPTSIPALIGTSIIHTMIIVTGCHQNKLGVDDQPRISQCWLGVLQRRGSWEKDAMSMNHVP